MVETTPKHYMYGLIVFTIIFMAGFTIMVSVNSNEGGTFASDPRFSQFNNTFNKYDDLNTQIGGLQSSAEGSPAQPPDTGSETFVTKIINKGWNSLRGIFTGFSFVNQIFDGLSEMFGVPVWFTTLLGLLVVVMILFAIWGAIFQTQF